MEAMLGLFAASFAAATLIALPLEAALFAYLQLYRVTRRSPSRSPRSATLLAA